MAPRPLIAVIGLQGPEFAAQREHYERRGFEVRGADEEWSAQSLLDGARVDVAIVDLVDCGQWGMGLLRKATGRDAPAFVMIGRRAGTIDKVLALELGAADFVDETIAPREIAARVVRILIRRNRLGDDVVVLERSTVDLKAALVMRRDGTDEQLSPGQIALFRLFIENPHRVLGRDDIIASAPAEDTEAFDRSIDSRIVRLRRKLDTDGIVTVRGAGYRYDPPRPTGA